MYNQTSHTTRYVIDWQSPRAEYITLLNLEKMAEILIQLVTYSESSNIYQNMLDVNF